MKHRTFLTTLILFLLTFNLGILLVCVITFKESINRSKERSIGEHYFIVSGIVKDFTALESRETNIEASLGTLLQPYHYLAGDKNASLTLYRDKTLVYSIGREIIPLNNLGELPREGNRLVETQNIDDSTYVIVSGKLPQPFETYTAVYYYDITETILSWEQMKNILFFAGFILSGLLALCLLILLNRLFKPLSQISQTSHNIAAGSYDTRLPVSGNDELTEMSRSFNHMAKEIQCQMKELINAAESKQQFIDNFSHELRTPLAVIYGYAEYIQKAALAEEDRQSAVEFIMLECRRIQTMAYQLLDLANLKYEQITLEEIKISGLFETVRLTLHNRITQKEIQIEFIADFDILSGDACLLQSLFENLIDNAMKACGTGGHIKVHAAIEAGNKIISIQDNGKGMEAKDLQHIMEPFYRGDKSRSRKDGSAGLGLAICNQIALCHGAELTFSSHPGTGTTAKIIFTV